MQPICSFTHRLERFIYKADHYHYKPTIYSCAAAALIFLGLAYPKALKITACVGFAALTLYEMIKCVVKIYEGCFPPAEETTYYELLRPDHLAYVGSLLDLKTINRWRNDNYYTHPWLSALKGEITVDPAKDKSYHLELPNYEAQESLKSLAIPEDRFAETRRPIENLRRYHALCHAVESLSGKEFHLRSPHRQCSMTGMDTFNLNCSNRFSHYIIAANQATTELFVYDLKAKRKVWTQNLHPIIRFDRFEFNFHNKSIIWLGDHYRDVATGSIIEPKVSGYDWIAEKHPHASSAYNNKYVIVLDKSVLVYSLKTKEILRSIEPKEGETHLQAWICNNYCLTLSRNNSDLSIVAEVYNLENNALHTTFTFASCNYRTQGQLLFFQVSGNLGNQCIIKIVDLLNPMNCITLKKDNFFGRLENLNSIDMDQLYLTTSYGNLEIYDLSELLC